MLALVGSSAAVARELGAGIARRAAIDAAQTRVERLAALPCAAGTAIGSTSAAASHESWNSLVAGAVRAISVRVDYADSRAWHTIELRTQQAC